MRKAFPFGVAAIALVAVLAIPAGASAPVERDGVTVFGTGSVAVQPDVAEWSFGVQARASTARRALATATARTRAVVAAVRRAGVAGEDVQTEAVSLWPRTGRGGVVVAYVASSSVRVVVRDLGRAGAVIEAAVDAGAREIFGPELTASNRESLYQQALDGAYDQARAKAERVAAKLGVTLGRPVAVVERGGAAGGDSYDALAAAESMVAIEPGRTEIEATLTVTFEMS